LDVLEDEVNGFVCKARDAQDLYKKMLSMLETGDGRRVAMGEFGREKATREFDQQLVFTSYTKAIEPCH